MKETYSLYEAKAKLSAIMRQVREGRSVVVTVHGEPVAEIRPITATAQDVSGKLRMMEKRGTLMRQPIAKLQRIARKRGALRRFLRDRDA
jgi:prevent-host-death family protein